MSGPRERTHELVVRHVEDELTGGRLAVGGRLPGERVLAERLGVSRASVREGIRVLEAMGLIHTSVGSGPDSGAVVVAQTSAGITSTLRLHMASSSLPVSDIVKTRVLLESSCVRAAASHGDPGQLAVARGLLDEMDAIDNAGDPADASGDGRTPAAGAERFHLLDADFHVALARAAGNEVVSAIMTSLREVIHGYVMAAVTHVDDWPAMARRLRRQHRNILAAVEAGDAERAARLVVAHIEGFYRATSVGSTD